MPRWFLYLPMKPEERAQHRWPPVSGASTPILPRVRSISAIPFVVPIDLYAFQAAVLNRYARRVTYPVHLVVSRETCSEPLRWYSVSTVRTPLYCLLRHPHAPMRRQMHSPSK